MIALEPVITVRELPPARARLRQHLPSLRELVRALPSAHEPALLTYLANGVVCGIYNDRGLLFDVLQPQHRIDATQDDSGLSQRSHQASLMLTDGAWVWSGVLPYYVATSQLQLPVRF